MNRTNIFLAISVVAMLGAVAYASVQLAPKVRWELRPDGLKGCVSTFYRESATVECVTTESRSEIRSRGLAAGIGEIERVSLAEPALMQSCHPAMHTLGRDYAEDGLKAPALPTKLPGTNWRGQCSSGFLHGYMQGLGEDPTATAGDVRDAGIRTCLTMELQDHDECVHATGHGIMRKLDNDLAESLEVCGSMPATVERNCYSGAVMEQQIANDPQYRAAGGDAGLQKGRALDCTVLEPTPQGVCRARLVVAKLGGLSGKPAAAVAAAEAQCGSATGEARDICYTAVGYAFLRSAWSEAQFRRYAATCLRLDAAADRVSCAYGFGLRQGGTEGRSAGEAFADCEAFDDAALVASCATGAGRGIAIVMDSGSAAEVCADAPAALRKSCGRDVADRETLLALD